MTNANPVTIANTDRPEEGRVANVATVHTATINRLE
jgi:hypothetical protein